METEKIDMKIVVSSLNSLRGQVTSFLGRPHQYPERSTVNEQLGIFAGVLPSADVRPFAGYLTIGNAGHGVDMSDPALLLPYPIEHRPTDVGAWGPIPLVLRPVENDLSDSEKERVCGRVLEEHHGQRCWAYYAKRIRHDGVRCTDWKLVVRDGKKSIEEFHYTDKELHSKPPVLPDYNMDIIDQIELADGDYVYTNAVIKVTLDEWDIKELLNMAKIKYKDARKAVVSEFIVCTGSDMMVTGESFTGPDFNYLEGVGLQSAVFISTFTNAALSNKEIGYDVTIGQTTPMPVYTGATRS